MISNEALRWAMTAVLLAAAVYSAFRASRKSALAGRIDHGLHALMMTAMVVMLAPGNPWPALPQILIFGLAAWWFVLRTVSRRAGPGPRLRLAGRSKPLYDALAMAAMAYMLATMDLRGTHETVAGPEAAAILGQGVHHGGQLPPWSLPGWGTRPTLILAIAFLLAGFLWAAHMMRGLRRDATAAAAARVHRLPAERALDTGDTLVEFVGALSMAVMLAALAA